MGLIMEKRIKIYNIIAAVVIFFGLPILFWLLGDFPSRNALKNGISLLTIFAFCMMLAQFYLARSNKNILAAHKMSKVLKYHKYIGYIFISILIIHPFLIVVPKYFDSGLDPIDAFVMIITTFESSGIILGITAWILMLIIGVTSFYRKKLFLAYPNWRYFHGILSIVFIIISSWHAIELGRHINLPMSIFIIILAGIGVLLLLKTYFLEPQNK